MAALLAQIRACQTPHMPVSAGYKAFSEDLLSEFGPVEHSQHVRRRRHLCRWGDIRDLVDDTLYSRPTEDFSRGTSPPKARDPSPIGRKGRPPVAMSYWEVPERLLDDPTELAAWARRAYAVALAAKTKRGRR